MRWRIVLEGKDEFGPAHRSELAIDKDLERLSAERGRLELGVSERTRVIMHLL
jgi:hypothetical protein